MAHSYPARWDLNDFDGSHGICLIEELGSSAVIPSGFWNGTSPALMSPSFDMHTLLVTFGMECRSQELRAHMYIAYQSPLIAVNGTAGSSFFWGIVSSRYLHCRRQQWPAHHSNSVLD